MKIEEAVQIRKSLVILAELLDIEFHQAFERMCLSDAYIDLKLVECSMMWEAWDKIVGQAAVIEIDMMEMDEPEFLFELDPAPEPEIEPKPVIKPDPKKEFGVRKYLKRKESKKLTALRPPALDKPDVHAVMIHGGWYKRGLRNKIYRWTATSREWVLSSIEEEDFIKASTNRK